MLQLECGNESDEGGHWSEYSVRWKVAENVGVMARSQYKNRCATLIRCCQQIYEASGPAHPIALAWSLRLKCPHFLALEQERDHVVPLASANTETMTGLTHVCITS